ncbi:MAG: hypothetical protein OEZ20_00285 [candidate division WOR-3 bacterium]|nr:hypothetical protein [candidate division WOR-3 bacterium]
MADSKGRIMAQRDTQEQIEHDNVITALKKTLFKYPNDKYPQLKTFANHPIKTHYITNHQGGQFYPDLVVLDVRNERVVITVEVETISSINEIEAAQWNGFASICENFYLFFPRGFANKVKKFCQKFSSIHCYEYWKEDDRYRVEHITF